jgi:hypothetical protein
VQAQTPPLSAGAQTPLSPANAQAAPPAAPSQPLSADQIAAQIKSLHPKTVVFVFDVTESTNHNGVFSNERAATATILRDGCEAGDRVVLESFGTSYKTVFDQTLSGPADVDTLVDEMPPSTEPGHGTNIRLPHHAALKLIAQSPDAQGVIVLLTDSFNDRPLPTDATYPDYLSYYTLDSLTHYPPTPQNSDYASLLARLLTSGRLHQYGVGIGIAEDGRPIERLPVAAGEGDDDTAPAVSAPPPPAKPQSPLPLILGIAGVAVVGLVAWGVSAANRPVPLRLKLGDKSLPRDFRLKPGSKVALGGALGFSAPGDEVFPLAGVTKPIAFAQAERGGITSLLPGELPEGGRVYHNGVSLEAPVTLHSGDEIRISVPDPASPLPKDYRLHVVDPKE